VLDRLSSLSEKNWLTSCIAYNDEIFKTGNKTANINVNVKKLQFINIVNSDRSKTAKIIKKAIIDRNNIDIQAMYLRLFIAFL